MAGIPQNTHTNITSLAVAGLATQVATGPSILEAIIVNVSSLYTVALIDNTSGSTITNGKIYKSATTGTYRYNGRFANGIRIITTGATTIKPDITVVWRQ